MRYYIASLMLICLLPWTAHAATKEEQRENIRAMRESTLQRLYQEKPQTIQEIKDAVGYAVFTSADVVVLLISAGYGHGIAHDSRTGEETFMQMATAGIGFGVGAKDFNTIFIFNNSDSFDDFVNTGLDLSGQADIAAKQGTKGGAFANAENILPGVKIYQMTDTGLVAQLMLKGTKYWKDNDLNNYSLQSNLKSRPHYNE